MAGYAGARPRGGMLAPRRRALEGPSRPGGGRPEAADLPRRSVRSAGAVRARRRQGRVGYIIVGIVVAFLLGLFSLAQTVKVSATDYDVDSLLAARQQLEATRRDLQADLARLGGEPAIRKQAMDAGLSMLIEPLVVPAR